MCRQGDAEKCIGLPPSPFCDRLARNMADSQKGFYDFIVLPLYNALNDYLQSRRVQTEVLAEAGKQFPATDCASWVSCRGAMWLESFLSPVSAQLFAHR